MQMTEHASLAAIRFKGSEPIDQLLNEVTRELQRAGLRVGGFLQREFPLAENCCSIMFLENVASGKQLKISQDLGRASRGCRLDPSALAELSGELLRSIAVCDFIVLNRFGKGEAEGGGFRQVIAVAVESGVPVLTAVRDLYFEAWIDFTGRMAQELPPKRDAIAQWCLHQAGHVLRNGVCEARTPKRQIDVLPALSPPIG